MTDPRILGVHGDGRELYALSLEPGSLQALLDGQFAFRIWVSVDADGYVCLHASVPAVASAEAYLRIGNGPARDGEPPIPDPDERVADQQARWAAVFEGLIGGGDAPRPVPLG